VPVPILGVVCLVKERIRENRLVRPHYGRSSACRSCLEMIEVKSTYLPLPHDLGGLTKRNYQLGKVAQNQ
jgi:hypothetical protein